MTIFNAQQATASFGATTVLAQQPRIIPIVVIPGIMGTRLTDPNTNKLVWNPPPGNPGAPALNKSYVGNPNKPAVPDSTHGWPVHHDDYFYGLTISGYYELVLSHYGNFLKLLYLLAPMNFVPRLCVPRIYCVGYDWRQSNAMSAQRLAARMGQIVSECHGERAFIIAHSMGGLVARYYCKNLGGEDKVRGLFLLGSPSLGAISSYRFLKSGIPLMGPDRVSAMIRLALGQWTEKKSRDFMRHIPSAYQLMPHQFIYGHVTGGWLTFQSGHTGYPDYDFGGVFAPHSPPKPVPAAQFSDCKSAAIYLDKHTGLREFEKKIAMVDHYLGLTYAFHMMLSGSTILKTYMHPDTELLFSNSKDTMAAAKVWVTSTGYDGTWVKVKSELKDYWLQGAGDGTVPTDSASVPPVHLDVTVGRKTVAGDHVGLVEESVSHLVAAMASRL